jgi:hypothetical protein
MFWIRHPRPLLSTRAVAMQVVARKGQALRDTHRIIIDTPAAEPAPLPADPPSTGDMSE